MSGKNYLPLWDQIKDRIPISSIDKCWPWLGGTTVPGYPLIYRHKKREYVHRLMFAAVNGYYPEVVRHICDNPPCVNPFHLLGGTEQDNKNDMVQRGRSAKGEKHWNTILREEDVKSIRQRIVEGETQTSLAKEYGLTQSTISNIKTGKHWGWLR